MHPAISLLEIFFKEISHVIGTYIRGVHYILYNREKLVTI